MACALLDRTETTTRRERTEWCAFWDTDDPNAPWDTGLQVQTYDSREDAEAMHRIVGAGGVARRQVAVTPWEVVPEDARGGEVGDSPSCG